MIRGHGGYGGYGTHDGSMVAWVPWGHMGPHTPDPPYPHKPFFRTTIFIFGIILPYSEVICGSSAKVFAYLPGNAAHLSYYAFRRRRCTRIAAPN